MAVWVILYLLSGHTLLGFLLTPGVLPALAVVNLVLAAWRLASGVDAARRASPSRVAVGALGITAVVLVLVPHIVVGRIIVSADDFLDSISTRRSHLDRRGTPCPAAASSAC